MLCDSCDCVYINGVKCHEAGCPDAWKDKIRECRFCGSKFKPEEPKQAECSHSCHVAYNNIPCDCDECTQKE